MPNYADGTLCATAGFYYEAPGSTTYVKRSTVSGGGCHRAPTQGYTLWTAYYNSGGSSTWPNGSRLGNKWSPNPPLSGFPTESVHS